MNPTTAEQSLLKGVNLSPAPIHVKLQPGWKKPVPPKGFTHLVAILALNRRSGCSEWFLDYLEPDSSMFASEFEEINVPWPWIDGFQPTADDWDAIGIAHLI